MGIGPGLTPSTSSTLSNDTKQGLADAVTAGPARVQKDTQALFAAGFDTHDGYLLGGFGRYGTDYATRAVISQIGLGAFVPHQAIYAMSWSDNTRKPLDGSTSYTLHMATPPPTSEGWSVTTYTLQGALVPNSLGRYALSNTSPLTRNSDGSIDVHLGPTQPAAARRPPTGSPLPPARASRSPGGCSRPTPSAIDGILGGTGWQPPAIATTP